VNLLGFDTSTAATSACVLRADGRAFELRPPPAALFGAPGHSRELLPALAAALEQAELDWPQLGAIAVGVGPGTFTGLRIGIATARALAGAAQVGLRPVSSLSALAAGIDAPLALPLIDARRGQLFGAVYEGPEQRWPAFTARPEELAERVRDAGVTPLAAGDGAVRFRELLEAAGIRVEPDRSAAHVISALQVCRLATGLASVPPGYVVPDYQREPDAEPHSR